MSQTPWGSVGGGDGTCIRVYVCVYVQLVKGLGYSVEMRILHVCVCNDCYKIMWVLTTSV